MMIVRNWPNDTRTDCSLFVGGMLECFKVEEELLDDHENELKEVGSLKMTTKTDHKNIFTILFTLCNALEHSSCVCVCVFFMLFNTLEH
jgi:hypothetical protein